MASIFRCRARQLGFQTLYRHGRPLAQLHAPRTATKLQPLQIVQWCLLQGHVYLRAEKLKHPQDYKLADSALQTVYQPRA